MKHGGWIICAALLAGCGQPEDSPIMRPGDDCQSCHDGTDGHPRAWTAAGTVYGYADADSNQGYDGVQVLVTDSVGTQLTLLSNSVGNFYTAEALEFPIAVQLQLGAIRVAMNEPVPASSCNACHGQPPTNGAPGRVYLPPP